MGFLTKEDSIKMIFFNGTSDEIKKWIKCFDMYYNGASDSYEKEMDNLGKEVDQSINFKNKSRLCFSSTRLAYFVRDLPYKRYKNNNTRPDHEKEEIWNEMLGAFSDIWDIYYL